jgi:hypothetical protein
MCSTHSFVIGFRDNYVVRYNTHILILDQESMSDLILLFIDQVVENKSSVEVNCFTIHQHMNANL